ncbi:MATH domain and coiled-coil domain-containing At3g58360-like isoform X1 [Olea europaea subsp. europaea]|uniref:MATH domain and coiled-coil domain-containing At3g58360-like isoform X1 n=1 Tax=Olea europaea subsp. europaea TaxID=158383 RepID=A0A8S0SMM8_OLEEU|nr:MATH domain and coiled-coil domain-containing At3g58360-like isoform X1 [Olea europaea subsp. europaea]
MNVLYCTSLEIETKQSLALFSTHAEADHQFKKGESNWGFPSFLSLSKLHDKYGGYVVDGTCVIEAEVFVTDVFPLSTDKPSDSSVPTDQSMNKPSDLDEAESIYIKAESFLKSISKEPTTSVFDAKCAVPLIEDVASSAKERFDELISFPLDNLVDPKHETAMIECLHMLVDRLSLFSDEQAKEITRLRALFPTIIQEWRDSVQVKVSCQSLLSTFEKTENLLKGSVKTEEGIKIQLEELKIREQELKAQLEALQNESQRLEKERLEVSKQTQHIYALAEEQAVKIEGKEMELAGAENKLEDLKSNWASVKTVSFKHEIFGSQHLYFGGRQFICCFLAVVTALVCYLIILCN